MALGGYRPGSGRKPGYKAKVAEAYNALLAKEVEKEGLPIIRALIKRAKSGDVQAVKEIHERLLGKVAQPLSGDKDNPIEHRVIYLPQRNERVETTSRKANRSSDHNASSGL